MLKAEKYREIQAMGEMLISSSEEYIKEHGSVLRESIHFSMATQIGSMLAEMRETLVTGR